MVKSLLGRHGESREDVAYAGLRAIARLAEGNAANCSSLGEQGACAGMGEVCVCGCEECWKAVCRSDEVMLCMNGVAGCCIATQELCSLYYCLHLRCVHRGYSNVVRD